MYIRCSRCKNFLIQSSEAEPCSTPAGHSGQAILDLLHTAADKAETDSRQALETAQRLSSQLRAAQDRIAELEAELQLNRDRANRAEEWLSKISTEIADRLIKQPEEKRREVSRR